MASQLHWTVLQKNLPIASSLLFKGGADFAKLAAQFSSDGSKT